MPDLFHALNTADTGYLLILARNWDLELPSDHPHLWLDTIVRHLTKPENLKEFVFSLPRNALSAFVALQEQGGHMTWMEFTRRFGELREMGAGRRDREHPELNTISATESLWYSGLIGRAFLEKGEGLLEYAFIPDEFMSQKPSAPEKETIPLGRPARREDTLLQYISKDGILDHACTLLAAIRNGLSLTGLESWIEKPVMGFLIELLQEISLISADLNPNPEATRTFLESPRNSSQALLIKAWQSSTTINELRLLPQLSFEGIWKNDPLKTRHSFLALLEGVPLNTWWDLDSLISAIHQRNPDFQRQAGDYDAWFIRDGENGEYLRGFNAWMKIEGRLIEYYLQGPLFWLGIIDLASAGKKTRKNAFRLPIDFQKRLSGMLPWESHAENGKLRISSNGLLAATRDVPRAVRYQVARFCEWDHVIKGTYHYKINSGSLAHAAKLGLKPQQLMVILKAHSSSTVSPSLLKAVERWEKFGVQAHIEHPIVLRFSNPEILTELQKSAAQKFLGEIISPTMVIVKPGREEQLLAALAELGWLGEIMPGV